MVACVISPPAPTCCSRCWMPLCYGSAASDDHNCNDSRLETVMLAFDVIFGLQYLQMKRPLAGNPENEGFLDGPRRKPVVATAPGVICPRTRCTNFRPRTARWSRICGRLVSCSYCWPTPMECRSAPSNAGSVAANVGLTGPIDAVIPGRKAPQMQVGAFSNAGCYN